MIGKGIGSLGKGAVAGALVDGGVEYAFRRHENPNESVGKSAVMAGASAAAWLVAPHVMWATTAVELTQTGRDAWKGAQQGWTESHSGRAKGNFGGNFQDNQMAYTLRQRGVHAIRNSKMNGRNALGGEARSLHYR